MNRELRPSQSLRALNGLGTDQRCQWARHCPPCGPGTLAATCPCLLFPLGSSSVAKQGPSMALGHHCDYCYFRVPAILCWLVSLGAVGGLR